MKGDYCAWNLLLFSVSFEYLFTVKELDLEDTLIHQKVAYIVISQKYCRVK